jgi:hypothetical protein
MIITYLTGILIVAIVCAIIDVIEENIQHRRNK